MNEEFTREDYLREIMKLQKRLKRRNPNDLTGRNNEARKKDIAKLERRLDRIEKLLAIKRGRKAK